MPVSWNYLLIVLFFTVAYGQLEKKDIRSISSGTSFGMCSGYCRESINVTSNPLQIVASKEANSFSQKPYPVMQQQFPISSNQWEQLTSLINWKSFTALGNTIGCPDCYDGGAEWIQVDWRYGTKRVTFGYRSTVKEIQELIEKLRQIRKEYLAQLKSITKQ